MRRVFAVRFERFENTRMGYGTAAQTEHGGEARRGGVANTLRAHERDLTVAGHHQCLAFLARGLKCLFACGVGAFKLPALNGNRFAQSVIAKSEASHQRLGDWR
jgi:hypothetical protein